MPPIIRINVSGGDDETDNNIFIQGSSLIAKSPRMKNEDGKDKIDKTKIKHFAHRQKTIDGGTSYTPSSVIHLAGCPCGNGDKLWNASQYEELCWQPRFNTQNESFDVKRLDDNQLYYWGKNATKIKHPIVCRYAYDQLDSNGVSSFESNGDKIPQCDCRRFDQRWVQDFDTGLRLLLDYSIELTEGRFSSLESLVVDDIVIPTLNYNDKMEVMNLQIDEYDFEGIILQREKDGDSSFGGVSSWVVLRDNDFDNNSDHILLVEDEESLHRGISKPKNIMKYKRYLNYGEFEILINQKSYFPIFLKSKSRSWVTALPLSMEDISINGSPFTGIQTSTGSRNNKKHNFEIAIFYDDGKLYSGDTVYPLGTSMWLQIIFINRWRPSLDEGTKVKLQSVNDVNGIDPKKDLNGESILDEEWTTLQSTAHIWVEIPGGLPSGKHRIRVIGTDPYGNHIGEGCRIIRIGE
jgi:hypothetical protein